MHINLTKKSKKVRLQMSGTKLFMLYFVGKLCNKAETYLEGVGRVSAIRCVEKHNTCRIAINDIEIIIVYLLAIGLYDLFVYSLLYFTHRP